MILAKGKYMKFRPRTAARLVAGQLLYQFHITGRSLGLAYAEFQEEKPFGKIYQKANYAFVKTLIDGLTGARLAQLDTVITQHLTADWSVKRLDKMLHVFLQLACNELIYHKQEPGIIVKEYGDAVSGFLGEDAVSLAYGVMNGVIKAQKDKNTLDDLMPTTEDI
jgi:transcription termination factor NusB